MHNNAVAQFDYYLPTLKLIELLKNTKNLLLQKSNLTHGQFKIKKILYINSLST